MTASLSSRLSAKLDFAPKALAVSVDVEMVREIVAQLGELARLRAVVQEEFGTTDPDELREQFSRTLMRTVPRELPESAARYSFNGVKRLNPFAR